MIAVENLSKRYAGGEAVKGITFSVEKGEVVGFLGTERCGQIDDHADADRLSAGHRRED